MKDASGDDPARRRAAAIDGFARRLRELRSDAGNPPFREMAGRSRAISHTTLHEAAQGHRLPSWATVVEFAKACDADPDVLRAEWQQADRAVRAPAATAPAPSDDTDEVLTPLPKPQRRRLFVALGGATAVLAVAAVVLVLALTGGRDQPRSPRAAAATPTTASPTTTSRSTTKVFTSGDCPVQQSQPPLVPPATRGDKGEFIGDITVPDCSHVPRSGTFTKIWRFKNAGSVRWQGYAMRRLGGAPGRRECQTIRDVPVPDTAPGREVDVSVQVTAPSSSGFCFVRYKVVNDRGATAFPGGRPITFQVIVD